MALAAKPFENQLTVFLGFDSREPIASEIAAHSICARTKETVKFHFLNHRDLRKSGLFKRTWIIDADTGNWRDLNDAKPFSTEFSHTRFLIPELQLFGGWALFMDSDMIFRGDIKGLFELADPKYAVMCVKHHHDVKNDHVKMDGREQLKYYRKNWSSFVLWNCDHPANKRLTKERVNFMSGRDMHGFSWLKDEDIGSLPFTYNYISGVSPKLPQYEGGPTKPEVIHYTEGGPWFEECRGVPYADLWDEELRAWRNADEPGYDGHLHKHVDDRFAEKKKDEGLPEMSLDIDDIEDIAEVGA